MYLNFKAGLLPIVELLAATQVAVIYNIHNELSYIEVYRLIVLIMLLPFWY